MTPPPLPGPVPGRLPQPSDDAVYAAVAARRTQFDGLVWQVPVLSLTAQAFLFTVALTADTGRIPRSLACFLAMIVSFLTVQIFTRHRQAEITDAHLLADMESGAGVQTLHGYAWQARRNATPADVGPWEPFSRLPGYRTWVVGLALFGIAAMIILVLTWAAPSVFQAT